MNSAQEPDSEDPRGSEGAGTSGSASDHDQQAEPLAAFAEPGDLVGVRSR